MFIATLLLALAATLATGQSSTSASIPKPSSGAAYRKVEEYSGQNFFEGFTWWDLPDPTGGFIKYVDIDTSATNNLTAFILREEQAQAHAEAQGKTIVAAPAVNGYVGVDFQQQVQLNGTTPGMNSVRLVSKATFDVGLLVVVDVLHAPTGPGVWPAVWLLGNVTDVSWPNAGEIDIMEWVNTDSVNHMTLHTQPGCSVNTDESAASEYSGNLAETDCSSAGQGGVGSLGCSITAPPGGITSGERKLATAGAPFNKQGGGVYVAEWTSTGVTTWLFPRNNLPADLTSEKPNPSSWTAKPLAKFSGTGCDFSNKFQQQQLIINIDLCGQWAGSTDLWQELANETGTADCNAYVASHPESFRDAYFEFNSIKMYSSNAKPPGKSADHPAPPAKVKREESYNHVTTGQNGQIHAHHHPHHPHLRQREAARYEMKNDTVVERSPMLPKVPAPGPPKNTPAPVPPPSLGTTAPKKSSGERVEAGGYLFAAFVALFVAALL